MCRVIIFSFGVGMTAKSRCGFDDMIKPVVLPVSEVTGEGYKPTVCCVCEYVCQMERFLAQ